VECDYGCIYFTRDNPGCKDRCTREFEAQRAYLEDYRAALKKAEDLAKSPRYKGKDTFDRDIRFYKDKIRAHEADPTYCADEHTVVTCGYAGLTNGLSYASGTRRVCPADKKCGVSPYSRDDPAPVGCV
jgi:hypothetical protein